MENANERKRKRTRSGCLNCRRKKKKCDDRKPVCTTCSYRGESCQWGLKVSFREEHSQCLPENHPSMLQDIGPAKVEIIDVTEEVIREYWSESRLVGHQSSWSETDAITSCLDVPSPEILESISTCSNDSVIHTAVHLPSLVPDVSDASVASTSTIGGLAYTTSNEINQSATQGLLNLSHCENSLRDTTYDSHDLSSEPRCATQEEHFSAYANLTMQDTLMTDASSDQWLHDSIFLPGSAYLDLHSTLRDHMFESVRSAAVSRHASPGLIESENDRNLPFGQSGRESFCTAPDKTSRPMIGDSCMPELTKEQEFRLWQNWIVEISPWLDKFDHECHFGIHLPRLAKDHQHLRYAMLALSARQQERKNCSRSCSTSLRLYSQAIHFLIEDMETRSAAVVASSIVLCVLEMMSCSPRMWRRHLDGCAGLIQSIGITGFCGGLEQALFWCFARMDLWGGFISSEKTIIPIENWSEDGTLARTIDAFRLCPTYDSYANFAVYLCAHVVDLLATRPTDTLAWQLRWRDLFQAIGAWWKQRPPEMIAILELGASVDDCSRAFPKILFSNAPAISANQLHHTAAILMLKNKPSEVELETKTNSLLWHARQICAISASNTHHGCWINSIQPLWIAGRFMSHPAEHQAILDVYNKIEEETGWGAKWRAEDLSKHWGHIENSN